MTPGERIGPYRIERLLGAGGMGVVFLAWDDRLDRHVALKRLPADRLADPIRRRRLRSEARAVARLRHPATVQLYDLLEDEDGDVLVMEYVPGVSLAERLRHGPLPLDEALAVTIQIAQGLAAAHEAGLLHRDLKAENVRLTPAGQAKILDFGLALAWQAEGRERLTGEGLALGTCRAMSPEQARGADLDPRSDLFSLGVLIHELVTGLSPFRASTAAGTLLRVCTFEPPHLDALVPGVPAWLSRLVAGLLEKDPGRRPTSAAALVTQLRESETAHSGALLPTAATARALHPTLTRARRWTRGLLLAGVGGALLLGALQWAQRPLPALAVAVPRAIVDGVPAESVPGGDLGLRAAVTRALLDIEGLVVLAPEQVDPVSGPPDAVARATAADDVFTSRLACGATQCRITLARLRGHNAAVLWTESFPADPTQPLLLREAAVAHVRAAFKERRTRGEAKALAVSPQIYAEFVALRRGFEPVGASSESLERYLADLEALRRDAPRFVDLLTAEALALKERFRKRRDAKDLDRALELLEQAESIEADDPRTADALFNVALAGQRLDLAEKALERLGRLSPGDPAVLVLRGRLAEKRGDPERALADLDQAVRRLPSWRNLFYLASMEARHGRPEASRGHLAEVLARFPECQGARSLLAELELLNGDPARAAELYTALVSKDPALAELSNLGLAQLLLRRFDAARDTFARATRLEPRNPFVALNLADATALAQGHDAALPFYRRALELAGADPATSEPTPGWQLASVRAQALAHLGRGRDAVAQVQRVLAAAADAPQADFEAALVYAVAGERTSALVSADRALKGGVQPRWFELPAFDSLRTSAEFAALLKPPSPSARGLALNGG